MYKENKKNQQYLPMYVIHLDNECILSSYNDCALIHITSILSKTV